MAVRGVAPLIGVRDVARSVSFYAKLGFSPVVEWSTYAKLTAVDGAALHLAAEGDAPPDRPTVAVAAPDPTAGQVPAIVVVEVSDCRRTCAELAAAGVDLLSQPTVPEWGGEVRAFLRDPDGHVVELNEPTG
jgi:catechol 2,3-dioxygenase-like lactoylglutathione lyase family enzyme